MLGLWSLGSAPVAFSSHIAFKTSVPEVLGAGEALRAPGLTPLSFFRKKRRSATAPPRRVLRDRALLLTTRTLTFGKKVMLLVAVASRWRVLKG